ncbi:MAG TPA: carboxypeptidase regulatory-like domain-containing protein [Polyangiaceae bacterium]|jgi:protocatechuate 3,4-dioxygenase beta subunit|nr:carboxypeptidase regulatory-like domain-containing protein [Polyangiaceae bacterium]
MESLPGRNAWLTAALLCATMLIVPLVGWLLIPTPSAPVIPPAPSITRTETVVEGEGAREAQSNAPAPVAPRPRASPEPRAAEEEAWVAGVVLDPDGKPVPRAVVTCDEKNLTATTNDEGRFELGPEAIGCSAATMHPSFGPSERVTLRAGDGNVLRLAGGGAIAGVVLDESGSPVPSYLLAIESFRASGDPSTARPPTGRPRTFSDPAGQFLLERLPPGRYVLTASSDGRPPARSSSIEVEAGRTTHHVRITLARGATLSGTILDGETRRPIAGARVVLDAATSTGANAIGGATSDASGAYSLEGVPPGPFSVRVEREGYRTKIVPGLTTRGASAIREDIALTPRGDGGAGDSELVGIGAVLAPSPDGVTVANVIDGGPAARAGLQGGDRILRIDGADVTAMPLSDCVQRLRGQEGSRVSIAVAREGGGEVELSITRAMIVR